MRKSICIVSIATYFVGLVIPKVFCKKCNVKTCIKEDCQGVCDIISYNNLLFCVNCNTDMVGTTGTGTRSKYFKFPLTIITKNIIKSIIESLDLAEF